MWLLDVDGVLNAAVPDEDVWQDWRHFCVPLEEGARVPVTVAAEVLTFLRDVHTAGLVEIRWLTSWGHAARTDLAPALGLPDWPVASCPAQRSGVWWKAVVAREVASSERPVVWTDDQIMDMQADAHWPDLDIDRTGSALVLTPDSRSGLGPVDLDRILVFLLNAANRSRHPGTLTNHEGHSQ